MLTVAPRAGLLGHVRELREEINKCAPPSILLTQQAIDPGLDGSFKGQLGFEAEALDHLYGPIDHAEAVQAFFKKRPPRFRAS
jgi:enoyl-CoA hydratase/carnithine racemase